MAIVKIFFACGALDGDCSSPAAGLGARIFGPLFCASRCTHRRSQDGLSHALQLALTSVPTADCTAVAGGVAVLSRPAPLSHFSSLTSLRLLKRLAPATATAMAATATALAALAAMAAAMAAMAAALQWRPDGARTEIGRTAGPAARPLAEKKSKKLHA